jgi:hypothetical protein
MFKSFSNNFVGLDILANTDLHPSKKELSVPTPTFSISGANNVAIKESHALGATDVSKAAAAALEEAMVGDGGLYWTATSQTDARLITPFAIPYQVYAPNGVNTGLMNTTSTTTRTSKPITLCEAATQ